MNGVATIPDKRIFLTYTPSCDSPECPTSSQGKLLHLRNPKSGEKTCYLLMNETLQEVHWFKHRHGSWFLDNYVLEDGSLYMCSPVDPIFTVLPLLEEARMKKGSDQGKFRALEEILFVDGYPGYIYLQFLLSNALEAVCDVRDIGASKYYRLDDDKVLAWLSCKFKLTLEALDLLGTGSFQSINEEEKKAYAVELLGEYIKAHPWLDLLCNHLCINLEASRRACSDSVDVLLLCASKANIVNKESKISNGKSKLTKKGQFPASHKMSEFFARKR